MRTTHDLITQIRQWITSADGRGVPRSEMQLHLSQRDISGLKRSSEVRTDEISFADGVMRFLGVEVEAAAATGSSLGRRVDA